MKRKLILILFITILCNLACKKKKKEEPAPEPTPAPTPAPPLISVKINGSDFNFNGYSSANSSGLRSLNFTNSGTNESLHINFDFYPALTTYTFGKINHPTLIYYKGSDFFRSVNGTISITERDTTVQGFFYKFKATFDCHTDTMNSLFFNLTNGSLNYVNP